MSASSSSEVTITITISKRAAPEVDVKVDEKPEIEVGVAPPFLPADPLLSLSRNGKTLALDGRFHLSVLTQKEMEVSLYPR